MCQSEHVIYSQICRLSGYEVGVNITCRYTVNLLFQKNLQKVTNMSCQVELLNSITEILICDCIYKVNPGQEDVFKQIFEVLSLGWTTAFTQLYENGNHSCIKMCHSLTYEGGSKFLSLQFIQMF